MAAPPTTPQRLAAEFLGTAFLVYVGAGSAAATGVLSAAHGVPFSMAQLGVISFAFMLVIVGAVYAIGHISGGHINPAVTVSFAVTGKFPWREVPGYVIAQVAGALIGALGYFVTLGKSATVAAPIEPNKGVALRLVNAAPALRSPRHPPAVRPRHNGIAARAVLDHMPIDALALKLPRRRDFDTQRRTAV